MARCSIERPWAIWAYAALQICPKSAFIGIKYAAVHRRTTDEECCRAQPESMTYQLHRHLDRALILIVPPGNFRHIQRR